LYTYINNTSILKTTIFLIFLGAVVGTIVCSMFNGQQPIEASGSPDNNFFTPSFCSNSNHNIDKSNENISIGKMLKFVNM
jgi:hypothetical protein